MMLFAFATVGTVWMILLSIPPLFLAYLALQDLHWAFFGPTDRQYTRKAAFKSFLQFVVADIVLVGIYWLVYVKYMK